MERLKVAARGLAVGLLLAGLAEGDAHVIRNAGGVVTDDEIRSLAISQRLLGTEEIILIHHTDCGMLTFTDDEFKRSVQDDTGIKPEWAAEAFSDLDEDVRQSIARITASPFVPHRDAVRGFVFDVATGRRPEVAATKRSVAGIRFGYPDHDCVVRSVSWSLTVAAYSRTGIVRSHTRLAMKLCCRPFSSTRYTSTPSAPSAAPDCRSTSTARYGRDTAIRRTRSRTASVRRNVPSGPNRSRSAAWRSSATGPQ